MSHKKSKNKQRQNYYNGYTPNQQARYSGEDGLSEKSKEHSNTQE